jgi:predicted component of type VI protein secretion system
VSHIAAALAKSKGKTVAAPTENIGGGPNIRIGPAASPILKPINPTVNRPQPVTPVPYAPAPYTPAPAAAEPAAPRRTMLVVVVLTLAGLGAGGWWLNNNRHVVTEFFPTQVPAPAPSPAPAKKAPKVQSQPVSHGPSEALAAKVRALGITAAAGGGSQRLSVGRKVYEPGDTVVEGLILQSIENDEIIFRDAEGNLYTRRL